MAVTMSQAVREFVQTSSRPVTSAEIRDYVNTKYPNRWRPSTLQAHLYACQINNPKAYIHHPFAERFLFKNADGTFELYSESLHGPNQWDAEADAQEVEDVVELAEASVSLEGDLENHLVQNLAAIEPGLKFVGRQVVTAVGRLDILAESASGQRVIIELKVGEAKDSAIGQVARYMGWYATTDGKRPRAILIAEEFPQSIRYAGAAVEELDLLAYRVQFAFSKVTV